MDHIDNLEKNIGSLANKKILDLGSGFGKFLLACVKRGYSAIGLELNPQKISQARVLAGERGIKINIFQGQAEKLPFPSLEFDFINLAEVIEHVENPKLVLQEMFRVLRPQGCIYVSVPNRFGFYDSHYHLYLINWLPRCWAEKILDLIGKQKKYRDVIDRQKLSEMHYFTRLDFQKLAESEGFSLIDIRELRLKKIQPKFLSWLLLLIYRGSRFFYWDTFHFLLKKNKSFGDEIIFIANHRLPTEKAHGFQIAKMCEEFSRLGLVVELWHSKRFNKIKQDLFSYYHLEKNFVVREIKSFDFIQYSRFLGRVAFGFQSLFFLIRLWREKPKRGAIIFSRQPEIVWLFKKKGYKTFFEAHFWPVSKNNLFQYFISKADGIVCNSQGTAKEFIKRGFKKILVAPNGVDLSSFSNLVEDVSILRRDLNLPNDKKIIMYVGHLYHWKGVDTLIQAAKIAPQEWIFVLVGGTDQDLEKYHRIVEIGGLKNIFLIGRIDKKNIPFYLKAADCLVLPNKPVSLESEFYTSPIKMFEYMASGVPIVASSLPSLKEILTEQSCLFFEAGNEKDLIEKIKLIFFEPLVSQKRVSQAKGDVLQYSWDKRAQKIYNYFYE
ncbi:MAG: glycosyltransferase [Candidatus Paceibacterota bacterium]|jgi:glycosyltransferase involved in cell wall biosynthesis